MPVGPFSRYRTLPILELIHATRGPTRSLSVRRPVPIPPPSASRQQPFSAFQPYDLLALKYYGREDLYWFILDANGGGLPSSFQIGETILIPPIDLATRVPRSG
jgi:hypothetical protein